MAEAARPNRVPELDLLRFCAALAVMLFHFTSWAKLDSAWRLGWLGVPLFFLISGFVILWSATHSTPRSFVASRMGRLYPSFWVCATLTVLIGTSPVSPAQYLANMTFAHFPLKIDSISSVYWTLYVEIKFYVLIFLLLLFGQIGHVGKWAYAWLAASFVPALEFVTLGDYGPLFAAGMFMFLIWRDGPSLPRLGGAAVAAVAGCIEMSSAEMLANYGVPGQVVPAMLVLAACHLAMLAIAMRWIRIGTSMYVLGSLTYPLYLIHGPLGNAVWTRLDAPAIARIVAASIVALLVSAVIAAYVERRACGALTGALNRWFDRILTRKSRTTAATGQPA